MHRLGCCIQAHASNPQELGVFTADFVTSASYVAARGRAAREAQDLGHGLELLNRPVPPWALTVEPEELQAMVPDCRLRCPRLSRHEVEECLPNLSQFTA